MTVEPENAKRRLFLCHHEKKKGKHLTLFSFSGPENEMDLILCRAAIFEKEVSLNTMTICANH